MKRIEQELDEAKSSLLEKQLLYEKCVSSVSMLEKSIKDHDSNREGWLKDLEKKVKAMKDKMQSASKDLKVVPIICSVNLLTTMLHLFKLPEWHKF